MNEFNLEVGMKARVEIIVAQKDTAEEFGSGGVKVLATPLMIGLMEKAAMEAIEPHLPNGYGTVGTNVNVSHLAATPIGMKVYAIAEVIDIDRKKINFKVEAFDEREKIGEGSHDRYIIELEKFISKSNSKKAKE
ncbi:thioesterase family protein [Alkaliphilus peptidifermentans]|uniref:Thioesterase superfamily n=1 Tax=Alkaliphilus peptidifermentans DSM 18978 TaxID=1120976 RepID=A0A1G5I9N0_9FIRM|nr:thioesterase family protein [Alkaliphilus peptidifermentans]SCY72866.1 Thioesterase superfamily [Alkaliphilus peptidifermentans DSM 18978]